MGSILETFLESPLEQPPLPLPRWAWPGPGLTVGKGTVSSRCVDIAATIGFGSAALADPPVSFRFLSYD